MAYVLSKHELASSGNGDEPMTQWTVFMHRVYGIPGEEGYLLNARAPAQDPQWQYRRIKGEEYGEWTGDFPTADDALAALQEEVNAQQRRS